MRLLVTFLCFAAVLQAYSQNCSYIVNYNGRLMEQRNYENGNLQSVIAYNLSDTKDSIVFENTNIESYHYQDDRYIYDQSFAFPQYYYGNFDKSLSTESIYTLVKNYFLLEDVIWTLATIGMEDESTTCFKTKRKKSGKNANLLVIYSNFNAPKALGGVFKRYTNMSFKSIEVFIKQGTLAKIILKGRKYKGRIDFEYQNGILKKERVYSYNGNYNLFEEYSFEKK